MVELIETTIGVNDQLPSIDEQVQNIDPKFLIDTGNESQEDWTKLIEHIKIGLDKYWQLKSNPRSFLSYRLLLNDLSVSVKKYVLWGNSVEWINEPDGFILDGNTYDRDLDPKNNQKPENIAAAIQRTPRTDVIYNGTGIVVIKEIVEAKDNTKSILPSRMNLYEDNYQKKVFVIVDSDWDWVIDRSWIYPLSDIYTNIRNKNSSEDDIQEKIYNGYKRSDENNELDYLSNDICNKFKTLTEKDFKTTNDFEQYNKDDPEKYDENGSVKFNKEYFYNLLTTKGGKIDGNPYVNRSLSPEEQEQAKQYYTNTLKNLETEFIQKDQSPNETNNE